MLLDHEPDVSFGLYIRLGNISAAASVIETTFEQSKLPEYRTAQMYAVTGGVQLMAKEAMGLLEQLDAEAEGFIEKLIGKNDPLPEQFEEFKHLQDEVNNPEASQETKDAQYVKYREVTDRIQTTPATSVRGIATQLECVEADYGSDGGEAP